MTAPLRPDMQRRLLRQMTVEPELLRTLRDHMQPAFFATPFFGWVYGQLCDSYRILKALPDETLMLQWTEGCATGTKELFQAGVRELYAIDPTAMADRGFIKKWATQFTQGRIMRSVHAEVCACAREGTDEAEREAIDKFIEGGQLMRAVSGASPDRTLLHRDYEAWLQARNERQRHPPPFIPTGLPTLDAALGGGLEKGRLGLVLADTKSGKSTTLRNFAMTACDAGFKVLFLVYEGSREEVESAFHSVYAELDSRLKADELFKQRDIERLRERYRQKPNSPHIRSFTSVENAMHPQTIEGVYSELAYLKETGVEIDLILIDYGDLLRSGQKTSSMYEDQLLVYSEIKGVANCGYAVWSATQARRREELPRVERPLNENDVAHCIDKSRVCDALVSINITEEERRASQGRLYVAIQRNGESHISIPLHMQMGIGKITEMQDVSEWVHHDAGHTPRRRVGQTGFGQV